MFQSGPLQRRQWRIAADFRQQRLVIRFCGIHCHQFIQHLLFSICDLQHKVSCGRIVSVGPPTRASCKIARRSSGVNFRLFFISEVNLLKTYIVLGFLSSLSGG